MPDKITMADWTSAVSDPLLGFFEAGGPLATASGPHYSYSRLQHDYASSIRARILGGLVDPGMVRILEAEPGTGKTKGYGGPALLHAALTGRRVLISTFTNYLKRQIGTGDGPELVEAVQAATGRRLQMAMRHSYLEFASPERAANFAAAIEAEEGGPTPASIALRDLAAWTSDELDEAEKISDVNRIVAEGRGLVGTWEEQNPDIAPDLPRESAHSWAIDGTDPEEMVFKHIYDDAVQGADVILSSHASTILDLKHGGRLFGGDGNPFAVAIIDEADRMADAARTVLSTKLSLRSVERSLIAVSETVEALADRIKPGALGDLRATAAANVELFGRLTVLADTMSRENAKRRPRRAMVPVMGNEDWLSLLSEVGDAAAELAEELWDADLPELRPLSEILETRADVIEAFVRAAHDPRKADGRTFISFSPVNSEPSVLIDAKFAGRLLHRMWDGIRRNGYAPFADAVILTSATAAQPGARGPQRWHRLRDEVGLGVTNYVKFDAAGCATFAPERFADLDFVLADPTVAAPGIVGAEPDAALRYQARMIATAARRKRDGRCNVVALTTSFSDTRHLEVLLTEMGLGHRLIARHGGMTLRKAVQKFREAEDPILVTPGAWEGIDMPGLIDHLVICRLPWSPPDDEFGRSLTDFDEETGVKASANTARMMQRLKQGIGRCTRRVSDRATVWIADPRFPLPATIEERLGQVSRHARNRAFHECVPLRFRRALSQAEVLMNELEPA